jgi:hypothetical protein
MASGAVANSGVLIASKDKEDTGKQSVPMNCLDPITRQLSELGLPGTRYRCSPPATLAMPRISSPLSQLMMCPVVRLPLFLEASIR